MSSFLFKREPMCQLEAIFEWLCKDERLGEKLQKAHLFCKKQEVLMGSGPGGDWGMTTHPTLLRHWPLAPLSWCPLPNPSGAQPCPFLPTKLLKHSSGGRNHCCLVSLFLINNLALFANKRKALFKAAAFGTLAITNHVGYQGSSRGLLKTAGS